MKRKFLLVALVILVCLTVGVYAGWERAAGRTSWVDRPTPATCWTRTWNGTLVPLNKIQVFDDTIRHYQGPSAVATTNLEISIGFWLRDSATGAYYPHPDITSTHCTTNLRSQGEWTDVEWDVNGDGILIPKP